MNHYELYSIVVHFDLDKSFTQADVRYFEKVIAYMQANFTVKIDVRSHTNSRFSSVYNNTLFMRRLKSTVNYIISKGIVFSRLRGNCYGD